MAMAKRSYSKRVKNMEPAVQNITVTIAPGRNYIDLSQIASLVNRRFYRQGINWAVAGFKVYKPTPTESGASGIVISKLPNTWVMANSWMKSFKTWQKMNDESLEETESVRAKFLDFKIYMNNFHHDAGFIGNVLPQAANGDVAIPGEWEASKIYIPDTSTPGTIDIRELVAVGQNFPGNSGATGYNAVSLIEGYAASRGLPNILDPNTPSDADDASGTSPENWMVALFNDGTTQDTAVLTDMITDNNVAPYPFENGPNPTAGVPGNPYPDPFVDTMYPNGANQMDGLELVDVSYFNAGTNANTLNLKGDNFPCGLIEVVASEECGMIIHLIPGHHRGYLCESMTEM